MKRNIDSRDTYSHSQSEYFEPFQEEDEIARVSPDGELQFGRILRNNRTYGTFEVEWRSIKNHDTVLEKAFDPSKEKLLKLVDRKHSEEDKVIHEDGHIGEIYCEILLASVEMKDYPYCIENIPMEDLSTLSVMGGELVELDGWIGKVSSVQWLVGIDYDDGYQATLTMRKTIKSNCYFGCKMYEKSSAPFKGQRVKPSGEEFDTLVWCNLSCLDSTARLCLDHVDKEATVMHSKISKVFINWLCSLSNPNNAEIPSELPMFLDSEEQIKALNDFDTLSKNNLKLHSVCEYIIKESDMFIRSNNLAKNFIDHLVKEVESEVENGSRSTAKKSRFAETVAQYTQAPCPGPGTSVYVEVIRVRHVYAVIWDCVQDQKTISVQDIDTVFGCFLSNYYWSFQHSRNFDLFAYGTKGQTKREFVQPRYIKNIDSERTYGVILNRNLRDQMACVQWTLFGSDATKLEYSHFESIYDLKPHAKLARLLPGAIVCIHRASGEYLLGIVTAIHRFGMVEVSFYLGGKFSYEDHFPSELIVIDLPLKHKTFLPDSSASPNLSLDEMAVRRAERIAKDLRKFLKEQPEEIKIKRIESDRSTYEKFSVLMTGPPNTPYEFGIFTFEITFPTDYPNSSPKIWFNAPASLKHQFLSHQLLLGEATTGEVLHPLLKNWPSLDSEAEWSSKLSLLDFLRMIRKDIFYKEPYLGEPCFLVAPNKERLGACDKRILANMTLMNASVVVTVFDLLFHSTTIDQPSYSHWNLEITEHFEQVRPRIKETFQRWLGAPDGILGDLDDYPKFHLFPLTPGLIQALTKRVQLLEGK